MMGLDIAAEGATPANARVLTETNFSELVNSSTSSQTTLSSCIHALVIPCLFSSGMTEVQSRPMW